MTRPKNIPRRCTNGHDLNAPENWIWRVDISGRNYKRCKPCLETSNNAARRRKSQEWHAAKSEDTAAIRLEATGVDPRGGWRAQAACAKGDPEMWFADWGEEEAVDTCRACPVRSDCLSEHLYEKFGVFGGTTPDKRDALRRNARRALNNGRSMKRG